MFGGASSRLARLAPAVAWALAGPAAAAPQNFALDPANTHVHWEIKHFGTSTIRGRFDAIEGSITLDREAHSGSASITIATPAVSTGTAIFDGVVRGKYLLSTEAFPKAYFIAQRFVFEGDQLTSVQGVLTLRDVGQALTLQAVRFSCRKDTDPPREVCGGDFEGEFKRSGFDITHSLPFVADRVRLVVQVEGIAQ